MSNTRFVTFASVISEIEQSDLFMTVKTRILETPKANLNGARVTEAFVDDLIANKARYIGLPLYADKKALINGNYDRLGHLYDSKTGEFHSTQIGSFYEFEKEDFKGGSYLVGYARIPKRDKDLSKAIAELFADGKLKFSYEIACCEYKELADGTFEIDAGENNYLEGTAIVTFPACEDAVALEFVAQRVADDIERGDEDMAEENKVVAEEAVETPVETAEATPQAVEEAPEKEDGEENASCGDKKEKAEETAAVTVWESHTERHDVDLFDHETGKSAHQCIEVTTSTSDIVDGDLVETDDGIHVAEEVVAEETPAEAPTDTPAEADPAEETPSEEPVEEPAEEPVVETPAVEVPTEEPVAEKAPEEVVQPGKDDKFAEMLNSLAEAVKTLTAEVKELKEAQKEHKTASRNVVAETVNPFVDSITANGNKYDLLEREAPIQAYTLLSK